MVPTVAEQVQFRVDRFQYGRVVGEWGGRHVAHGRAPGPDAILLDSEDYLRIGGDPRVAAAISDAATAPHTEDDRLARALADHMRAPAGIVCQSGWQANIGLFQMIADPRLPVYIDSLAHMSLWQAAKAAGAPLHPFRHNFPGHLREKIRTYGPGIIAVDALYGGTGTRAPLAQFCDVAEQTGSLLVVDESHALGIDGPLGAGAVVALGLAERVPFRTASLSKAFAGRAGFVCVNGSISWTTSRWRRTRRFSRRVCWRTNAPVWPPRSTSCAPTTAAANACGTSRPRCATRWPAWVSTSRPPPRT
ncbi:aminotransferase class I/II-fold pyridoxal phosphate-dependent enzyme [Nocardia takedensis]